MAHEHPGDEAVLEALLLGGPGPFHEDDLRAALPPGVDLRAALLSVSRAWEGRAVQLVEVAGGWAARTRPEHSGLCRELLDGPPRLSRAAMETLAAIAVFGPVTRPEIERLRGVSLARGTLDLLVWTGLVRPGPRRATPGSPLTFVVTPGFLARFALREAAEMPQAQSVAEEGLLELPPPRRGSMPGVDGGEGEGGTDG